MARRDPGSPKTVLDDAFVTSAPPFDDKLLFVFEIIPVTPLIVAPMVTPPGQVIPEPAEWQLATKSPELPLPGAVKPGQGVLPNFIGQQSPIKIEGHNITQLSLDMATHGFTGRMRFRVSETRLLGDVTDKDRIAKVFAGDDLLMVKLVIRPALGDQKFPMAMTPVMVPQVVGTVPIPVVPPTPPPPPRPVAPTMPVVPVVPTAPPVPPVPAVPVAVPPPPPTAVAPPPALPTQVPTVPTVPHAPAAAAAPAANVAAAASSPAVQALLQAGSEAGVAALVASNPELAAVFVALGVAAQAGLIPPPLAGPAAAAGQTVLASQPQVAAGLAMMGMAADAGMLPPELAPIASAAGQLAMQSNPEMVALATAASAASQAGGGPSQPAGTAHPTVSGNTGGGAAPQSPMAAFAQMASASGLLPPALADAAALSPAKMMAAAPLSSLMSLMQQVSPLAAQLSPTGLPTTGLPPAPAVSPAGMPAKPTLPPPPAPPSVPPAIPVVPPPVGAPPTLPKLPPPPTPLPQANVQPTMPGALPPKLLPLFQEFPELVGTPNLYENGMSPRSLMIPIELVLTAVITERTIIEHTSYNADDILVSIREYSITFADPAQALWRRHYPVALYTQTTLKDVIEQHCNPLLTVKVSGPSMATTQDQIFIACDVDAVDRERASFYDWLMWRLSEVQHEWLYDYTQNIYQVVPQPKRAEPFTIFAADIAEIVTHHVEGRFYTEALMNDYTASVTRDPILNLQTLQPLRQDRLYHTQVALLFEREYTDRLRRFEQPHPDFVLHFKRFPSRPFPPGVGLDFKLDPIDFPSHRFIIPKDAKSASRVYRLRIDLESKETDVLPRFRGYSGGMFRCAVAAQLQSGKDKAPRLPSFRAPRYPIEIEGLVHTDTGLPGEQPYQTYIDEMGLVSLRVAMPLFANQLIKVPFEPYYQSGHFFFPPYRAERVLVSLFYDRSEFKRFLNWRPGGLMPSVTQGNQIRMGQDMMNGAVMRLIYASDIPTYLVQRQRYSSNQSMIMYQSGIDLRTVELPPKIDVKVQGVVRAAGAAVEAASGAKDIGAIIASKVPGGAKGAKGAPKAQHIQQTEQRPAEREDQTQDNRIAAQQRWADPPWRKSEAVKTMARQRAQGSLVAEGARPLPVRASGGGPPSQVAVAQAGATVSNTAAKDQADAEAKAFAKAFPALMQHLPAGSVAATPAPASPQVSAPKTEPGAGRSTANGGAAGIWPAARKGASAAAAIPGGPSSEGYAKAGGALTGAAGGAGEYAAAVTGSTAEGVASLLAAAAGSAMSAALNLDSNLGVTLQYMPMPAKAVQTLRMDDKKNTLMSFVGNSASSIEQAGDTITITCKDFVVNAANIQLNSALTTTVQSLGTVSIFSKLAMLLKSFATLDISSDLLATVQALTIMVDAATMLAMQGKTGVGILGNGTGVQIYGSQVSATGLETNIVGGMTKIQGMSIDHTLPTPVGPPGAIPGLSPGTLPALAARLAVPAPLAVPTAEIAALASSISTLVTALPIKGPP